MRITINIKTCNLRTFSASNYEKNKNAQPKPRN